MKYNIAINFRGKLVSVSYGVYPAEPDVGIGSDYISSIQINSVDGDSNSRLCKKWWHSLTDDLISEFEGLVLESHLNLIDTDNYEEPDCDDY